MTRLNRRRRPDGRQWSLLRALLERHAHRVDGSRAHAAVECTPVVPDFYGARRAPLTFAVDTERSASHREAREGATVSPQKSHPA